MWQLFDLLMRRSAEAFFSSLKMFGKDVPPVMKIDAMIGRATHILNRAGKEERAFDADAHFNKRSRRTQEREI